MQVIWYLPDAICPHSCITLERVFDSHNLTLCDHCICKSAFVGSVIASWLCAYIYDCFLITCMMIACAHLWWCCGMCICDIESAHISCLIVSFCHNCMREYIMIECVHLRWLDTCMHHDRWMHLWCKDVYVCDDWMYASWLIGSLHHLTGAWARWTSPKWWTELCARSLGLTICAAPEVCGIQQQCLLWCFEVGINERGLHDLAIVCRLREDDAKEEGTHDRQAIE